VCDPLCRYQGALPGDLPFRHEVVTLTGTALACIPAQTVARFYQSIRCACRRP